MNKHKAQSTLEFTFAMLVMALLIYGTIKMFQWVGMDYAQGAYSFEQSSIFVRPQGCNPDGMDCFSRNLENNHRTTRMRAFSSKI